MTSRERLKITALLTGLSLCSFLFGCTQHHETGRPEMLIRAGWDNYRLGEFDLAARDFEAALAQVPQGGAEQQGALYGLATTWNLRRPGADTELAGRLYRQAISLAPTNDLAAWSWLALARMKALPVAGEAPDLRQQVDAYQEVISRFPFHPAGEEAFLFQQAARLETPDLGRTREVLDSLEAFPRTHPRSPWRSAAYKLVGHCCTVLGLPEKRLEAALQEWKTAEVDTANPADLSWTYWQLATLAEFETGDFALAREYYRKLIAEYPAEQRVFVAKQELQRMDDLETRIRQEAVAR